MDDWIFDFEKYKKGWQGGLPETPCGHGSRLSQTTIQRDWLPAIWRKYEIKSVADIGAGDLNWISKTDLTGVNYQAYDLVPRRPDVIQFNVLTDPMPEAECYMVLWVLNHFPPDMAEIAISRLKRHCDWLIMTWEPRVPAFLDLPFEEEVCIRKRQDKAKGDCFIRLHQCSKL